MHISLNMQNILEVALSTAIQFPSRSTDSLLSTDSQYVPLSIIMIRLPNLSRFEAMSLYIQNILEVALSIVIQFPSQSTDSLLSRVLLGSQYLFQSL